MRTKKTVFKSFSYLQCDDFAAYLMDMARKGWHFKEWRVGLVFEKGEPADTVYAVEVFINGSVYDAKPEAHTLEFADYCQAAGWELADAKQKFCIFRKVRPDAVEILTPEERLANIAKEERKQVLHYLIISSIYLAMQLLNFGTSFVRHIFSNIDLFLMLFWVLLWGGTVVRFVHFLFWKQASRKKLEEGKPLYFGKKGNTFIALFNWVAWIGIPLLLVFALLLLAEKQYIAFGFMVIFSGIITVSSLLISKFRPDSDTNQIIQLAIPMVVFALVIVLMASIIASDNTLPAYEENAPLVCTDMGIDVGEVKSADIDGSSSIFGSAMKYWLFYEDVHIHYFVYRSSHSWILDRVWEDYLPLLQDVTDVTAPWEAEYAAVNDTGVYFVRYPDAVILLALPKGTVLTPEQIEIARAALYESR